MPKARQLDLSSRHPGQRAAELFSRTMYKREGAVAGAAAKSAQFSIKKFWRRESTGEDTTGMDDEDGLDWSAIDQIVASQSQ